MKPTIFFSHSSLDKDKIKPIKDYIVSKTGSAIQIFLSSDGASIPFGRSWLKEIEDALKDCRLMFVWLTPASIKSNWIYFESGCAYSRGIKVVPLGFDGVNLEGVSPPLNILQGFDIYSAASLNNIVAIINEEFHFSFPAFFDDEYFKEVVESKASDNSVDILEYVDSLECIFHSKMPGVGGEDEPVILKKNWAALFENLLNNEKMLATRGENSEFYGLGFKIYPYNLNKDVVPKILIDPLVINRVWDILVKLSRVAYDKHVKNLALKVILRARYELPEDHYIISSRLLNTEVKFDTLLPNLLYKFRNVEFRINVWDSSGKRLFSPIRGGAKQTIYRELIILVNQENEENIPLGSLVKILTERGIIKI